MTPAQETPERELLALAEELRERTAMRYMGDCKCGRCQLVPRELLDRAYAAVLAATRAAGDALAWQDISTAPKDGRLIEMWHRIWNCSVTVRFYEKEGSWIEATMTTQWPNEAFTHWHELSAPPATPRPNRASESSALNNSPAHNIDGER